MRRKERRLLTIIENNAKFIVVVPQQHQSEMGEMSSFFPTPYLIFTPRVSGPQLRNVGHDTELFQ